MLAPAAPRWPSVRPRRGHYESYYVRAVDPAGPPRGIWIRYTVAVPPDGRPTARLWCTSFDRGRAPLAFRSEEGPVSTGDGALVRLDGATFADGALAGSLQTATGSARWELRWTGTEAPLLHLPRRVYGTRLPRTKLLSLSPSGVFDGWVEVDGDRIAVAGWPGMVGHNWGEEHAPDWIWVHGLDVTNSGTWLDVALARIRIGRVLTPWSAFGAVSLDGRRFRLGGPGRRVVVREEPGSCRLRISGRRLRLTADVSAPPDAFVSWDYPNPSGPPRAVVNCSVADLSLRVDRRRQPPVEWTSAGRAVYERGRSTPQPS
jgi:hypothetical protein